MLALGICFEGLLVHGEARGTGHHSLGAAAISAALMPGVRLDERRNAQHARVHQRLAPVVRPVALHQHYGDRVAPWSCVGDRPVVSKSMTAVDGHETN